MFNDAAALANVEITPPASNECPINSGKVHVTPAGIDLEMVEFVPPAEPAGATKLIVNVTLPPVLL
jgi:hypothetical protein